MLSTDTAAVLFDDIVDGVVTSLRTSGALSAEVAAELDGRWRAALRSVGSGLTRSASYWDRLCACRRSRIATVAAAAARDYERFRRPPRDRRTYIVPPVSDDAGKPFPVLVRVRRCAPLLWWVTSVAQAPPADPRERVSYPTVPVLPAGTGDCREATTLVARLSPCTCGGAAEVASTGATAGGEALVRRPVEYGEVEGEWDGGGEPENYIVAAFSRAYRPLPSTLQSRVALSCGVLRLDGQDSLFDELVLTLEDQDDEGLSLFPVSDDEGAGDVLEGDDGLPVEPRWRDDGPDAEHESTDEQDAVRLASEADEVSAAEEALAAYWDCGDDDAGPGDKRHAGPSRGPPKRRRKGRKM